MIRTTTAILAFALSLSAGAAFAQSASQQGAPTAAAPNSRGDRTEPGAVKDGTSGARPGAAGTVGASQPPLPAGASTQGAPTASGPNSMGDRTEPGAVKSGTSR